MRDRNYNSKTYSAVCDECGKPCELPFQPSPDKPVYCDSCFKNKQRENSRRSNFRNNDRSDFRERKMYSAVCDSCGRRCEVPFKPTNGKPIYCDNCFRKEAGNKRGTGRRTERVDNHIEEQIKTINEKLDKIINMFDVADSIDVFKDTKLERSIKKETKKRKTKKAIKKKTSTKSKKKKKTKKISKKK